MKIEKAGLFRSLHFVMKSREEGVRGREGGGGGVGGREGRK